VTARLDQHPINATAEGDRRVRIKLLEPNEREQFPPTSPAMQRSDAMPPHRELL
jgi:hypothetical protein